MDAADVPTLRFDSSVVRTPEVTALGDGVGTPNDPKQSEVVGTQDVTALSGGVDAP